ncbi:MAG TPA: BON domain-containing protein [Vicinamibacteria bacterium]
MRLLFRLVVFVMLVSAIVWFVQERHFLQGSPVATPLRNAGQGLAELGDNLDLDSIRDEVTRTGRVVRRKTVQAAQALAEATEDARTTAAIKARLALDPQLSALDIGVETTDGRVTLSGSVDSPEHLARLVRLALEHEHVTEVVSTVHIRPASAQGAP